MPSTNPHTSFAKTAFSISGASGLYDRARPNYPPAALSHILSLLPTTPARIVELGSGTGLFSRMLLEAGKGRIESLVCVEPAQGMREGFKNKLGGDTGGAEVRVVEGRFDEVPVETGKVDMVIAAQVSRFEVSVASTVPQASQAKQVRAAQASRAKRVQCSSRLNHERSECSAPQVVRRTLALNGRNEAPQAHSPSLSRREHSPGRAKRVKRRRSRSVASCAGLTE